MEFRNFFKDKLIITLSIIFIIFTIINIVYSSLVQRGLQFDGIIFFMDKMDAIASNSLSSAWVPRLRHSVIFLHNLPFYIGYFLFDIHSKYVMAVLYSIPWFLYPSLFPFFNYLLAKRSKRYDIVIWSLFIFGLLVVPTQMWPIVEAMLAVSVVFLLYHYICANIDYKLWDIICILMLIIISYASTESNIYVGPLLALISFYYARKTVSRKNKIIKYIISVLTLLMPIGYFLYFILVIPSGAEYNSFRFFRELFFKDFSTIYKESYLILLISIIYLILLFFLKKYKIKNFTIISVSLVFSVLSFLMFKFNWFYDVKILEYRVLLYIIPALVIILISFIDFINEKINMLYLENILINFLIVIMVLGTFNCIVQIMNSFLFSKTVNEILTVTESIGKPIVIPYEEEKIYKNKYFSRFQNFFEEDYFLVFVPAFSKNYKIKSILYPGDNAYKKYPPEDTKKFDLYIESENYLRLGHILCTIQNRFWNLSEIAKAVQEQS